MITDADVIEFQKLYEKRFGTAIDKDNALRQLTLLIRQMEIIYQPITRNQYEEYINEYGVSNEETEQKSQQEPRQDTQRN